MPVHTRRFSADELDSFPEDGNRYEVIDGELFVTPGPSFNHQHISKLLFRSLDRYAEACGLSAYYAPTAVRSSPTTEVQPDLLVFSGNAADVQHGRQITMSSLWLAVEILSPSTQRLDQVRKRQAYREGGVREYWIVDGDARNVEVWTPGATTARVERSQLAWQPTAQQAALTIDLVTLFHAVSREG